MKIFVLSLLLLFAAASTSSLIFYNRWKRSNRAPHAIAIDCAALKKKITQDPPEWVLRQIRQDLSPYSSGIAREMVDQAFQGDKIRKFNLVRFIITNGHVAVAQDARLLDSRHFRQLLAFINQLNEHAPLPDVDFIVSLEDGFEGNPGIGPCFVFAKNKNEGSLILIPDINAMTGYEKIRKSILEANRQHEWEQKTAMTFWRGSTTGGHSTLSNWQQLARAKLVLLSLAHPQDIDARFHHVVQCDPELPRLMKEKGMVSTSVTRNDHLKYKYLVDVDGNSCSFERYFWLLLSNSVVLKQVTPNIQWYYGGLEPYRHFLPIQKDLSDLVDMIQWAKDHDEECRLMAERSTEFIENNLTPEDTLLYMYHLLKEYALLQGEN